MKRFTYLKKFKTCTSKILVAVFIITNILVAQPIVSFAEAFDSAALTATGLIGQVKDMLSNTKQVENKNFDGVSRDSLSKHIKFIKNTKPIEENREKSEIIIKYKSEKNQKTFQSTVKSKVKKGLGLTKLETKRSFKNSRIDLVEIGSKDDIDEVIRELEKDPNVEYVQPNYKLSINSVPTDAMFTYQWGLSNSGQEVNAQNGRSGVDINAVNAFNLTQGSPSVVIGVLDTGIDINHPDLQNSIYINTAEANGIAGVDDDGNGYIDDINGWDFVNGDNTIYDDSALDYHGTHVSGILAAAANSTGIVGIAPNVKLMPLKFISGNWGYTCDIIDAIEYAMAKGVKIMNCSFGGTDDNFVLKDTMVNSGILFICAAGNRGTDVSASPVYPACFNIPNVLSVASIDSKGVLSPYSSYGNKIHVAAPGVNILSTTPNNTYDYLTGTSAAVPYVTGIAALLKSYLPNITIGEIASRIKNNVVPCTNLAGKVSTGGRVDAFAALTNTVPTADTYTGPGNNDATVPGGQQIGNEDTWYTMDQLAKIKEQYHYGESGASPATGNFSFTVNDMTMASPGFQINISRTYNSRSSNFLHFNRGWSFGFEGYVSGTKTVEVSLPSGSVERFTLNGDGTTYTPESSRSKFVKNPDGTYILTTKDQYKYTFNASRYLTKMEDRNGNAITIQVNSGTGKVQKITDAVNREFIINYGANGYISTITDPISRVVTYEYDSNNRLVRVIDPNGGIMRYIYGTYGIITEIQDHNQKSIEKLSYNYSEGENQFKVTQATDSLGCMVNYAYDNVNRKTVVTDMNNRVSTYWYDSSFYITQVQDPEGKSTYTEYYQYGGKNKYGEVKSTTDRNGNKTQYDVDNMGNVTKITNPDNSYKTFTYDIKNNLISERDEEGKYTFYIYDENKISLIKKAQPLNGTDQYTAECDETAFSVTEYEYYTDSTSGCTALGLLKSETDPAGKKITYTYDTYGNIATVAIPYTETVTNTTSYHYNTIGWRDYTISPKGNRTNYVYDGNGQLIKMILAGGGETSRIVYDLTGKKVQEIQPKLYDAVKEGTGNTYTDNTVGTRYEYYDNGKISSIIDALGNGTSYTYDVYGNVLTETKPNLAVYRYEYDIMDRIKKAYYSDPQNSEVLLSEYSYAILDDGKTQKTETKYLNSIDKAITVSIYDYAERMVEQQNPDGTRVKTVYNQNGTVETATDVSGATTYYTYDGLNRLTETWSPFDVSNGTMMYAYSKTDYDKAGKTIASNAGKDKVELYGAPANTIIKNYTYYDNGSVKSVSDNEGRLTEYQYDSDGNVSKEEVNTEATSKIVTEYDYNYMGKVSLRKQHVNAGDIYGNSFGSTEDITLNTEYTYDKNGNVETVKTPNNMITTYTYDELNRQMGTSQPGLDETRADVTITTTTTYNWEGKPLTKTDSLDNITRYEYDGRGFLTKVIDAKENVTAFGYDRAGRKITEVFPLNYDSTKDISSMSRVEYVYDIMDRLKLKKDIYLDPSTNTWKTIGSKAYQYDNAGNVIKELDALGLGYTSDSTLDLRIQSGYGTTYAYNFVNEVVMATDTVSEERALPYTMSYEYDALGRKTTETNAVGVETRYVYDDGNNLKKVYVKKDDRSALQLIKSQDFDKAGRQLTSTDANGATTTYEYNALGSVRRTIYPGDSTIPVNTVICQYDSMGNLKYSSDSVGKVNKYTYDNQCRQLSVTEEKTDGSQSIATSVKYDKNGNKRFYTDGNQKTTEYVYDELDRLVSKIWTVNGVSKIEAYSYDANGNQTTITDWRGNKSENVYDPLNRLIEKKDAYTKSIQRLEYNANNLQVESYDALNKSTQYLYDSNNRLIATIDSEGHTTIQSYDDAGNIVSKVDGRNIATTYKYDEFNRLTSIINAKGEITSYTYDPNGNMLTQTNGEGKTETYEYNAAGKLIRKIDHGGRLGTEGAYTYIQAKTESYIYIADGSMCSKLDRNGKTTIYTYDIHGRLESQTIGNTAISFGYDGNGNQTEITNSTGTTIRSYDEENRVTGKTVPVFGTSTYTYDITINMQEGYTAEATTDPKGNLTTKVYDKVGRLVTVSADGNSTNYEYYDNGSRKKVTYPSGATEEYTYYDDGLTKTLVNKKADGTVIDSYSYTYDGAHNQTAKIDAKGTTNYEYDSLNRLSKVTEPSGRVTNYTFDKAGNRLMEQVLVTVTGGGTSALTSITTTYEYNEQNRLMSTVTQSSDNTVKVIYAYDDNGNMVSSTESTTKNADSAVTGGFDLYKVGAKPNTGVTFYEYDVWNQLVKTTTGKTIAAYSYNGEGLRVSKTINGTVTNYLYEYDKVVLETDGQGNETAQNVYGTNLLSRKSGNETLYYMYNGHGDVTSLLDNIGAIAGTYYYDAFGNILEQTGDLENNITYAGYQYDAETGLYYLNARYYDSKIARFLSEDTYTGDPNDPLSLNLYTYCHNEPIMYWDPTGHVEACDVNLSAADQAFILQYTENYYAAKTEKEKDYWHQQAVAKRQAAGSGISNYKDEYNYNVSHTSATINDWTEIVINAELGGSSSSESRNTRGITKEEDAVINAVIKKETNVVTTKDFLSEPLEFGKTLYFEYGITNQGTGNAAGGPTIGSAPYTGSTISSGTLDPITQAAINEGKVLLNGILDVYHPYEWPSGYTIGDYTWSAAYKSKYQNEVNKAKKIESFFNTLDLADNIRTSYNEASEATHGDPGYTLAGTVVFTVMKLIWDDGEPGIGDLPDILGINSSLNKSIAKALVKSDYIDNSNYKYLVYSGQFLWKKGPRGMFIDEINKLQSEINNRSYSIYSTSEENNAYKQALVNYLGTIKNMNVNYNQSVKEMNFFLDQIETKYK